MEKLKKFNKYNKKNIMLLVTLCTVVAVVSATISYAVYQKTDEVLFINAKVGHFETSSSDIELAMTLDGEDIDNPPSKDNYNVTIECDHADGVWESTYDRWGAYIYNISSNRVKCKVIFTTPEPILSEVEVKNTKSGIDLNYTIEGIETNATCKYGIEEGVYDREVTSVNNTNCSITGLSMGTTYYYQICAINSAGNVCKEGIDNYTLASIVELGDYISMTPTKTSYTIPISLTGYTANQTINPSELNLWRVISKNEDGTVDAVSEYVSSTKVYVRGQVGWLNLVGTLNTIAVQYTNEKYVSKTRHMGYSNQIEKCASLLSCTTGGFQTDVSLVQEIGVLSGKLLNGQGASYYLADRGKGIWETLTTYYIMYYNASTNKVAGGYWLYSSEGDSSTSNGEGHVRPILTFKSTAKIIDGDGKNASSAYQFE